MALCCIKGCENKAKSRGLCNTHYERQRLGRSLDGELQKQHHGLDRKTRFERWIEKDASGCWIWTASYNPSGYGQFNLDGKKPMLAHRAAWIIYRGAIPACESSGYGTHHICHKCDNPKCVNPDHLFLGTNQENMDDKMQKGRHVYGVSLGEKHGNAKLTEEIVRAIRVSDETDAQLSKRYGISRSSIYAARRRQTWKHVT
jgi:hypothetical protein